MLPELIESILEIEEVKRFRLSSVEPASLGDEIITLMAGSPKFARHFHIPFQERQRCGSRADEAAVSRRSVRGPRQPHQ